MIVADRNVRDVTPSYIIEREQKRSKDSARQNAEKLRKQMAIAEINTKLREIEAKITKLRKEGAPEKQITAFRQSWDFHHDKLKKLKGK